MLADASYWVTWFPGSLVAGASVLLGAWRVMRRVSKLLDKVEAIDTKVDTNHGKTIGQHVESAALDAAEAKLEARRVRLELGEYKVAQSKEIAVLASKFDEHAKQDHEVQGEILKRLPPTPLS